MDYNPQQTPNTWPDLALALYERLTGNNAEIIYEFNQLEVSVPNKVGPDAIHANWKLNGTLKIRTRELNG